MGERRGVSLSEAYGQFYRGARRHEALVAAGGFVFYLLSACTGTLVDAPCAAGIAHGRTHPREKISWRS